MPIATKTRETSGHAIAANHAAIPAISFLHETKENKRRRKPSEADDHRTDAGREGAVGRPAQAVAVAEHRERLRSRTSAKASRPTTVRRYRQRDVLIRNRHRVKVAECLTGHDVWVKLANIWRLCRARSRRRISGRDSLRRRDRRRTSAYLVIWSNIDLPGRGWRRLRRDPGPWLTVLLRVRVRHRNGVALRNP